ncbi:MAG TPA: peptidase M15 [Porphyromonadaceae bacterium]|nr:peptidase M15 [Porphyromonadaceae bacterium]
MRYFTFQEFERSEKAYQLAIDNTMPEAARKNVAALVDTVLDPLREAWGGPIIVNSGYRCAALNKAVGGVPTSMHLTGHAADITTGNSVDNRRLYQLVEDLNLPYFELIGKKYDFRWLHISYNPERTKRNPS